MNKQNFFFGIKIVLIQNQIKEKMSVHKIPKGVLFVIAGGVAGSIAGLYLTIGRERRFKGLSGRKETLINKTKEVLNEGREKAESGITETIKEISDAEENYLVPARKKIRNYKRPY